MAALQIVMVNSDLIITWNSAPGKSYNLLTSTDLVTWSLLASGVTSPAVVPLSADSRKFFKLEAIGN